jgi:hypothetical protein
LSTGESKNVDHMREVPYDDELKSRLSTLFYSASAAVIDALFLYFILGLSKAALSAKGVLMGFIGIGLLFPCIAGILISLLFWNRKSIFTISMLLYGLIILAGSLYYIYLLPSLDFWGPLFGLLGIIAAYVAGRHLRQSHSE